MHKLIIEDDEGRSTVVPLVRDELTIGRKEGNAIRLTERNVSRRHARLVRQNGQVCIEDLASYTGVRVNGVRISAVTPVRDGDQVQIGDYRLRIRNDAAAEALPLTTPGLPLALTDPARAAAMAGEPLAAPAGAAAPIAALPAGAPAVGSLDASPTIPLRTLVEQDPVSAAQPTARLVAVTTDLAGLEFKIDRPSLVIGRTQENDVILNHPSISRHHAKIVRDGERYTVVDLQSANGVRVGGESYERVDVQPGDVIELGYVKLRFVGASESWHFDPAEFQVKSRLKLKVGAAAGGIALAVVLIAVLRSGHAPPPPPQVVVAAPVPPPPGPTPLQLLAEARRVAAAENWDQAVSMLDLLLSRPVTDTAAAAVKPGAAELKHKVDLERRSADIFASFQQAVASQEPDVALSRYDQIPDESVYKERAAPALPEMKELFVSAHLDLAEAARAQGQCDEAIAEAEKIKQADPDNKKAQDIVKKCRQRAAARVAAAAAPPAPAAPRPAAPRPARSVAVATAPAGGRVVAPAPAAPVESSAAGAQAAHVDAADLIRQAREAWLHQQCASAVDLSRRALKAKPTASEAYQIIAVCSCSMRDRDSALKAYNKLDDRNRTMVRSLCARNGLELGE